MKELDYKISKLEGSRWQGFTMVELLVGIAIAGILVAIALPSFTNLIANNRMTTKTNEIVTAINIARQAAISRGTNVFICRSENADSTTPECRGGGAASLSVWTEGVLVYAKPHGSVVAATFAGISYNEAAEDVLIFQSDLGNNNGYMVMAGGRTGDSFGFRPNGLRFRENNGGLIGICDDRVGPFGRTIRISLSGRVSTEVRECGES